MGIFGGKIFYFFLFFIFLDWGFIYERGYLSPKFYFLFTRGRTSLNKPPPIPWQ